MCGIAGIIAIDGFDPVNLLEMTHKVKHRGPDGYGFAYFDPSSENHSEVILNEDRLPRGRAVVGLGHRRLSILDLSARGRQPMQSDDGSLSIVFNGEIYNYLELRQELTQLGHRFKTRTDTEVLLRSYQQWGTDCLRRFNGMWSFAIWDNRRRQLFAARDRFGEKPFYYLLRDRLFLFGSEIKQLISYPGIPRKARQAAVLNYLEYGVLNHTEETFFQTVKELPGGHFLTLEINSAKLNLRVSRYWDLEVEEQRDRPEESLREEFTETFRDAVRIRMRSDVPVGSCLSGGLDSSSIVCVATRLAASDNFHTFSACFANPRLDERQYVQEVVAATRVKPHLVFPDSSEFTQSLRELLWHQDEPIAGTSAFAQRSVMQAARRENVPVLLDGQGGDEALCGYRKFYYFYLWHLLRGRKPGFLPEAVRYFSKGDSVPLHWSDAARYLPASLQRRSSVLARTSDNGFAAWSDGVRAGLGPGKSLAERQKADLLRFSLPVLLRYEDRNSMAHAIETRLPFLDHRLVQFLISCPDSLKLRDGWTKWILRDAMQGVVPERVRLRRRKLGFDTPESQWLRAYLLGGAQDTFTDSSGKMEPYLNAGKVRAECNKFSQGARDALPASSIVRPLILQVWAQVHDVSA
ncbi:MAG: asparagine synthase (glutamine-hydrolyzing) [Terriglobia bacterium]